MPTKFSEFFALSPEHDEFQKRVYDALGEAVNMVDCYRLMYGYIVNGLKWVSRKARFDLMDNTVDTTGYNPTVIDPQMKDAEDYFAELTDPDTAVWFEYLNWVPQDANTYGDNVFALKFHDPDVLRAAFAYRQVQMYLQLRLYNKEYQRQRLYQQNNSGTTKALPNGEIPIDATANRVNPDDPNQISRLTNYVDGLVKWIEENYPILNAVVNTKVESLYQLVFVSPALPVQQKINAIGTILEKIRFEKSIKGGSVRRTFGLWVIDKLEAKETFWKNTKISEAYDDIIKLKPQFKQNAKQNHEIYQEFQTLFANFLSPAKYQGESDADADKRRSDAFGYIQTMFETFAPTVRKVSDRYKSMKVSALTKITTDYRNAYSAELRKAKAPIPANDKLRTILPNNLGNVVKEQADECLKMLPLRMGGIDVRLFTARNFVDLEALNAKSVIVQKADSLRSTVTVPSDPFEQVNSNEPEEPNYRPIYRSIRFGMDVDTYIAFCNLPGIAAGTFYYTHVINPAIVKAPATNVFGRTLTIDFQNYTIGYNGKADPTKNEAGEPYRFQGKTKRFYDELKRITKWTTISAVRRYDPYYTTVTVGDPVAHLAGYVAAGRGTRTLPLDDDKSLCLWVWNCSTPLYRFMFRRLGECLGLPAAREIVPVGNSGLAQLKATAPCSVQIGGKQYKFQNYGPIQYRWDGFYYPIIGVTEAGKEEEYYVQVNTPSPGIAAVLTGQRQANRKSDSRPLSGSPKSVLELFDFSYYRRITTSITPILGNLTFSSESKVVQFFRRGDKRKPTGPGTEVLTDWPGTGNQFDAIGTNLPICFNVPENIIQYYFNKQKRGKIINKGNVLFREAGARKDAAGAMKPMHAYLRSPLSIELNPSKIPATAFASGAMAQSKEAREDWGLLKLSSLDYMPVNQEWCHLRGHGDGGDEYPGNFVSGSIHCNTEQLAIETGQRLVTQQQMEGSFLLHTTAYLIRDAFNYKSQTDAERQSQILKGNYLTGQPTYQDMLNSNTARRSRDVRGDDGPPTKKARTITGNVQKIAPEQGDVAPLAAFLRYKVMKTKSTGKGSYKRAGADDDGRMKYFDFIFEGQSEFIDGNQFALISRAVQFSLAGYEAFLTWYKQEKAAL